MNTDKPKSSKWSWIGFIVTFLLASWLFANWQDFKEGFADGYAAGTKSKP